MLDQAGALEHVVLSRLLWLYLAPLLAAVLLQVVGSAGERRAAAARATLLGLASIGFVTGVALAHAIVLLRAPEPVPVYVEYVTSAVRIGGVEANAALCLDWISAGACAFASLLAFTVGVWVAVHPGAERRPAVWVCLELGLTGALGSFLADGLMAVLVGWSLSIAAASWLAGWKDPRAGVVGAVRGAVALALLAFGACWLFWASAGRWQGRDFTVEQSVGFSAVTAPASSPGRGSLTLVGAPGASVYLGDARSPLATAPFVGVALAPGAHSLRVHAGSDDEEPEADPVVAVEVPARGASIRLIPSGPSLSLRDLTASFERAPDAPAPAWAPDAATVTAVLCIWIVAAWLVSVPPAISEAPAPLVTVAYGAAAAWIGPMWLARASGLLDLAPGMRLVLPGAALAILVAAVSALWAATAGRSGSRATVAAAALLERWPARLGSLLVRFEQWVIDALAGAAVATGVVAAWAVARFDDTVLSAPGEALAARTVRFGQGIESVTGLALGRLAWTIVGLAAAVVAAHGWWSTR